MYMCILLFQATLNCTKIKLVEWLAFMHYYIYRKIHHHIIITRISGLWNSFKYNDEISGGDQSHGLIRRHTMTWWKRTKWIAIIGLLTLDFDGGMEWDIMKYIILNLFSRENYVGIPQSQSLTESNFCAPCASYTYLHNNILLIIRYI